jgi:hypothetical protein
MKDWYHPANSIVVVLLLAVAGLCVSTASMFVAHNNVHLHSPGDYEIVGQYGHGHYAVVKFKNGMVAHVPTIPRSGDVAIREYRGLFSSEFRFVY